ncbi:MAG: hypothetical protein PF518_16095, partial [Spirochaetaceae bacterium]|nr:hypothetical protein [Spirochaetaceae bacterium]
MNNVTVKSVEYLERKAISQIRQRISQTENKSDLTNGFAFNVSQYINSVLEPDITVSAQDISFSPEGNDHYI